MVRDDTTVATNTYVDHNCGKCWDVDAYLDYLTRLTFLLGNISNFTELYRSWNKFPS